jgi:hypothetical protein
MALHPTAITGSPGTIVVSLPESDVYFQRFGHRAGKGSDITDVAGVETVALVLAFPAPESADVHAVAASSTTVAAHVPAFT